MIGKPLHEGRIAVFAGVGAAHIGINSVIRHRQIRLCHDIFDFDFLDTQTMFLLLQISFSLLLSYSLQSFTELGVPFSDCHRPYSHRKRLLGSNNNESFLRPRNAGIC